jgi:transposase
VYHVEKTFYNTRESPPRARLPASSNPFDRADTVPIASRGLLHRWREEAEKAGRRIERIVVAFEAGRDGFWLARWLKAHSIEAHVIHAASVAVSREHRRAPQCRRASRQSQCTPI